MLRLLLALSFMLLIGACSGGKSSENDVLICHSVDAYAYHDHECQGYEQCNDGGDWVSLEEALEMRRAPCGFCY